MIHELHSSLKALSLPHGIADELSEAVFGQSPAVVLHQEPGRAWIHRPRLGPLPLQKYLSGHSKRPIASELITSVVVVYIGQKTGK